MQSFLFQIHFALSEQAQNWTCLAFTTAAVWLLFRLCAQWLFETLYQGPRIGQDDDDYTKVLDEEDCDDSDGVDAFDASRVLLIELRAVGFHKFTRRVADPWRKGQPYRAMVRAMNDVLGQALQQATFAYCADDRILFVLPKGVGGGSDLSRVESRAVSTASNAFTAWLTSTQGRAIYRDGRNTSQRTPGVWFEATHYQIRVTDPMYRVTREDVVQQVRDHYERTLTVNPLDKLLHGLVGREILHGKSRAERVTLLARLTGGKSLEQLDSHLLHGTFSRPCIASSNIRDSHLVIAASAPDSSSSSPNVCKRNILTWGNGSGIDNSILTIA